MRIVTACLAALVGASCLSACAADATAMNAAQLERTYGVAGASAGTINTSDGPIRGMLVPITLAEGYPASLFIPHRDAKQAHAVYLRDIEGLHPIQMEDGASRADVVAAPAIIEQRAEPPHPDKRPWEKDALMVAGGAGTAIGARAGGRKGGAPGAAAGGVGGLIYDLATHKK